MVCVYGIKHKISHRVPNWNRIRLFFREFPTRKILHRFWGIVTKKNEKKLVKNLCRS